MDTVSGQASNGEVLKALQPLPDVPRLLRIGSTTATATAMARAQVGGKARELHRLALAGLPVPAGLVLTTDFFSPWIARLRALPAWAALAGAAPRDWPAHCAALRAVLEALEWQPEQTRILDQLACYPGFGGHGMRFAVRSSSPQEDLDNASFAGVYQSFLGVARDDVAHVIRACFASCMAPAALAYKAAHGLAVFEPAMAVIVQHQVDSEVFGVAFSINPLANDHDEMLVNAHPGLGDAVVDGRVTPDQFIVDKASGQVLDRVPGKQHGSTAPAPEGCQVDSREARACLAPGQLQELAAMVARIEALSGRPVDVEFAYAGQVLHLLQSRPVTTWVPLPAAMMSAPGAPRTLYLDIGLAKGMAMNAPVSPLGQDWLKHTISGLVRHCAGDATVTVDRADGWLYIGGGRMYLNLSRMLWLATPRQLARSNAPTDALLGKMLMSIDVARYRSAVRPSLLPLLRVVPRVLWRLRRPLWRSLEALVVPDLAHRKYQARERAAIAMLCAPVDKEAPLWELQQRLTGLVVEHVIDSVMPAMLAGLCAAAAMGRLARQGNPVDGHLVAQLLRGTSDNLVVAMNIAMFRMAKMLAPADFADPPRLAARIGRGEVPAAFLAAWHDFMAVHGCRGPGEMDLANPGYRDDPAMLLRQMSFMASAPAGNDPGLAHQELTTRREAACRQLIGRLGPVRRFLLKRLHAISTLFAGTRDTPKHINLLARQRLRECALASGAELVASGQLDRPEDIFGLCYADLRQPGGGRPGGLRSLHRERAGFVELLARQVKTFPALIDSRARILRAPAGADLPGRLQGVAISPGVVRGHVKCLHSAHGKTIEPGDILVAFSTDPGWTPLFVGAAAVVLEIGGVLQHGALVARELNKPCVAGIANVLGRLHDGQLVEVDGGHGTVSVIDEPAPTEAQTEP